MEQAHQVPQSQEECPMRLAALFVIAATTLPLGGAIAQHAGQHGAHHAADPIAAAIAAPSRTPANVTRDKYRQSAE